MVGSVPAFLTYDSFGSGAALTYASMLVLGMGMQVVLTVYKWVKEDQLKRELDLLEEQQASTRFAKSFLISWDNNLRTHAEVEIVQLELGSDANVLLSDLGLADMAAARTLRDRALLASRRFIGTLVYIVLQLAAWSLIIWLTSESQSLGQELQSSFESVEWLSGASEAIAASLVPAAVSVINGIMPVLIMKITNLEKWDREKTVVKMLTVRMYLAKVLNAFIQVLSFMLLANPYLMSGTYSDLRINVEQKFSSQLYSCRIQQAGVGLFQLVVTEFVVSKVIALGILNVKHLLAAAKKLPRSKGEFEIAKTMVSLLYFQALVLAAFPFYPAGGTPIAACFMWLSFKFDAAMLIRFKKKPKNPWKAQDAGSFFIKFYMATVLLLGVLPTCYVLTSQTFAKSCALQDSKPAICSSDIADDVCTMDTTNTFYQWFEQDCGVGKYPSCICTGDLACGPFSLHSTMWNVMDTKLRTFLLWPALVDYPVIGWAMAITLFFTRYFKQNALDIWKRRHNLSIRVWDADAAALRQKIKLQAKQIERLDAQARILKQV
ncbi:unnamed protein product [Chrysoparadoxa australica]